MAAQSGNLVARVLHAAGLSLALTADKALKVAPASNLTPALRDLIRSNKPALLEWLTTPAANDPTPDPGGWASQHSPAMSTAEIDRCMARLARFTDRGVTLEDAERMADRLVIRDREQDGRTVCLECTHLQRGGRCGNWQRAGVAIRSKDAELAPEFMHLLQRCDGLKKDQL